MKKVQSTCNYCALGCNFDFHVENEVITKVIPTKEYPVNKGFSCIKGLSLDKQQSVIKTSPLPKIRQEDKSLKEVSWDNTFKYISQKLLEIKEKYGSESIAGISTGQLTLEEFAIFGHLIRNHLKSHLDGNTRLCMATAVVAHKQSYGFDAPGFTLEDLELSDTIFFIGANPIVAHPIMWSKIIANPDKKIIVIDPRKSETAARADKWYGVKWRSDIVLLYTVANILVQKDYIDKKYIEENTQDFEAFKKHISKFSLEDGVKATGLSTEDILEMVEIIHAGKRVSFWWTMGVNQGYQAVRTAQAIINIALMTGNIGKKGTGANSITGQCNAMGSRLYSNTTAFYGGGDYTNSIRRTQIAKALGVSEDYLPTKPTIPYNEIIEKINAGEIKALWILCTNPRHSWINNEEFAKATKKLELFIVQDIYDSIESAEDATVILPVVSGIKKDGTYINLERRLCGMRPVLNKKENELTDYEVIHGVCEAIGMGDNLKGWETPKSCFELMKKCSEGMPSDITGINWEDLQDSNGIQWPFRKGEKLQSDFRRLYENNEFFTPNKKARFVFEDITKNPMPTSDEYPMILNTGRGTVGQWHTQTRTKEIKFINDVSPKEAYVLMNRNIADKNDIKDNDYVRIYSANGKNAVFFVKITDNVAEEELFAPMHYIECNKLTPSIYDPYSKEPSYKATPVRFEKV